MRADGNTADADLARAGASRHRGGGPVLTARTRAVGTYPTAARSFFAVVATMASGDEIEGKAGTLTPGSGTFLALNLGSAVPPLGTDVIVTFTAYRWTFRYDG